MSLGSSIRTIGLANAGLAALIGTKLYAVTAPQGEALPYVVWQKIASEPIATHTEKNTEADSFNRVQFTAVAATYEGVEAIGAALLSAFDNVAVLTGHPGLFEDERDLPSELPGVYARALDFTF